MAQIDVAREIWQRLRAEGFSPGVTAGFLGNMQAESGIIVDRWQGDLVGIGPGYGLVQWTPFGKFRDWATDRGMDPATLDAQITRILWEVANNEQWQGFRLAQDRGNPTFAQWVESDIDPEQAADDFVRAYERPEVINSTDRQRFARSWYDQLAGTRTTAMTAEGEDDMNDEQAKQLKEIREMLGTAVGQGQLSFPATIRTILGTVQDLINKVNALSAKVDKLAAK